LSPELKAVIFDCPRTWLCRRLRKLNALNTLYSQKVRYSSQMTEHLLRSTMSEHAQQDFTGRVALSFPAHDSVTGLVVGSCFSRRALLHVVRYETQSLQSYILSVQFKAFVTQILLQRMYVQSL
jgi:hypothetical protein